MSPTDLPLQRPIRRHSSPIYPSPHTHTHIHTHTKPDLPDELKQQDTTSFVSLSPAVPRYPSIEANSRRLQVHQA
ncbi:putative translation initiation factor eIF-2B subunit beta [Fusarium oxysporum f. sp. albedinis]|nr:putative translation initiation factor eIF-2B subunit beta [Fusarium oxysporum f. sp. albedinis]